MLANSKAVVLATITKDKTTRVIPLAVFARKEQAAPYGRAVLAAHAASDETKLTGLTLECGVPASEFIGAKVKLSLATLRYCPTIETAEADPFAEESSAAS